MTGSPKSDLKTPLIMRTLAWREVLIALNTIEGLRKDHLEALKTVYETDGLTGLRSSHRMTERIGLRSKLAQRVAETDLVSTAEKEQGQAAAHHVKIVTIEDPEYPLPLREIYSPPPVLYQWGTYDTADQNALALVGARQADYRGKSLARSLASSLARRNITVVSGLARGIDTQAHRGALEAGGRTIGVLGSGLGRFYPPENRELAEEMTERGCVFSEFPWDWRPEPRNFPRRNRIISGLSKGVVVVQAARRSGSLITARLALEQGKEVFALPGPPESPLSRGCHALIKQGAKLVENVGDVLEELGIPVTPSKERGRTASHPPLSGLLARLYQCLRTDPMQIDQICEICDVDPKDALPALLTLELRGLIVHLPGQAFARKITERGDES